MSTGNKFIKLELSADGYGITCVTTDNLRISIPAQPVLQHPGIDMCFSGMNIVDDNLNYLVKKYPQIKVLSNKSNSLLKIEGGKFTYLLSSIKYDLADTPYSEIITLSAAYASGACLSSKKYYVEIRPRPEFKFRLLFLPKSLNCMDLDTAFVNIPDRNDYSIYWSCIAAPNAFIRQNCVKSGAGVNGKQKFTFCFNGDNSYLGTYKFRVRIVTDSSTCEKSDTLTYTILKTVNSISHTQKEIRVYPNPIGAGGLLSLPEHAREVDLWDLRGVKVCAMAGSEAGFIVPAGISAGQYLLKFRVGDTTQYLKLSVQD